MNSAPSIRVLIADDSALMRNLITKILVAAGDIEVAGTARDGEDACRKAAELKPDVVTMDINMPLLDGISAMQLIVADKICPVIMFSSLTQQGAVATFECLHLGAFDFVAKPDGTVSSKLDSIAEELVTKIRAAAAARTGKGRVNGLRAPARRASLRAAATQKRERPADAEGGEICAIAIGISTGGPATISTLLPELPADISAALFLVQHMPASFIGAYVARLQRECAIEVVLAELGMAVRPGVCYVGGNERHLCVHRNNQGQVVLRTPSQPRTLFVPSVNVMMESILAMYASRTIGVLMTGIGDDGADQMVRIRAAGGYTIAESEESCVVFGMPYQAIKRGGAESVLPSWQIAPKLLRVLHTKDARASAYSRSNHD